MKLGWCAPLQDAGLIRTPGSTTSSCRSPRRTSPAKIESPLPVGAFNYFFPQDMRIVGPDVDDARLDDYLARAAALDGERQRQGGRDGQRLGAQRAGRVRARPRRGRRSCARSTAAPTGCRGAASRCAIEPLYRQGVQHHQQRRRGRRRSRGSVNRPEIRVLADFFHMDEENEPLETLREHRDWVVHIHLADTGRRNPGTGSYDYDRFFGLLKEIDYTGTDVGRMQDRPIRPPTCATATPSCGGIGPTEKRTCDENQSGRTGRHRHRRGARHRARHREADGRARRQGRGVGPRSRAAAVRPASSRRCAGGRCRELRVGRERLQRRRDAVRQGRHPGQQCRHQRADRADLGVPAGGLGQGRGDRHDGGVLRQPPRRQAHARATNTAASSRSRRSPARKACRTSAPIRPPRPA